MTRMTTMVAALVIAAGCDKPVAGPSGAASATPTPVTTASAAPTQVTVASATASADSSAAPDDGADVPPAKKYGCGAKGQKPCPMQGWMKRVMGVASSSGDGPKLAEALAYAAKKPPPGMADWTAMANDGAAKAKAGDIEGAKASCKKCHERHKETYKATMRDKPW